MIFSLIGNGQASPLEENQVVYIGVEKSRAPYSSYDEKQQAHGILITRINALCKSIKIRCEFVEENFDQLLYDVKNFRLRSIVTIDRLILPEIDKVKLTPPLCQFRPILIESKNRTKTDKNNLKVSTVGVLKGSLLYYYFLDEYRESGIELRPYSLLENAIFDLANQRIDKLLASQVFFIERLKNTPLGKNYVASSLDIPSTDATELTNASMSLAFREKDRELQELFTKHIRENSPSSDCSSLLPHYTQPDVSALLDNEPRQKD